MEEFEKQKKEYLERVNANEDMLNKMKEKINTSCNDAEEKIELITNPKNEKELVIAEALFTILEDILLLADRVNYKEVKEIPLDESKGAKALVNAMKAIMNNEENVVVFDSTLPPVELAEQMYQVFVSMSFGDELSDYLAKELNIDTDSLEDLEKYMAAWLKLIETLRNSKNKASDPICMTIENCTDKEIEDLIAFKNKFHELCENGKKEMDVIARIADAIATAFVDAFDGEINHRK